ncbi:MAG: hypothetical protein LBK26_01265 [Rickettsiales bacterium]|jgi:ASC-1-like (ASCH) protein|nr:hypothetical protein [Rickettsiales bacterium]
MVIHHESIIDKDSFDLIKSGAKHLKFYLDDSKRQGLKSGNLIKYTNKETAETMIISVKQIIKAESSDILARKLGLDREQVIYINSWFSAKDQEKHGLLAVQIEKEA